MEEINWLSGDNPLSESASLIVIAGPPCSGKSTLADELSRRLNIASLSMDGVRRRILPGAAHTRADREVAYRAMHLAAECVLRSGGCIILDAPYGHAEDRRDLFSVAEVSRARLLLVELKVSPEMAAERLRNRGPDPERPDLTETIVAQSAREYPYSGSGLLLDTEVSSPDKALQRVIEWIRTSNFRIPPRVGD